MTFKLLKEFLIKDNILPYLAIGLLAYLSWTLWEANIKKEIELQQAKEAAKFVNEAMGIIQSYNEQRFADIEKIQQNTWKEGRHEASF
jgi:hypothetical protein